MFEIVKAIHEALHTDSTWAFVSSVALVFALLSGAMALVIDRGYKNSLHESEHISPKSSLPLVPPPPAQTREDAPRSSLSDADYVNPGGASIGNQRRLRLDQAEALGIWLNHIRDLRSVRVLASSADPEAWEFASDFVRTVKMAPRLVLVNGGMVPRQTEGMFGVVVMLGNEMDWKSLFSAEVDAAFARSFIPIIGRGVDLSIPRSQIDIIVAARKHPL